METGLDSQSAAPSDLVFPCVKRGRANLQEANPCRESVSLLLVEHVSMSPVSQPILRILRGCSRDSRVLS